MSPYFTPEEYLELEVKAEYKSQYVAGEIFSTAGAEPWHAKLAANIGGMLHIRFRNRPCDYYSSDMRLGIKAAGLYTYPDVVALCGEPQFDVSVKPRTLLNPQVIFEVLSPSTEAFDRGDKFARYRLLESLADYVLVASERMRVEHFVRQSGGAWTLTEFNQPEHRVPLASVQCELPLAEIYERVTFPDPGFAA